MNSKSKAKAAAAMAKANKKNGPGDKNNMSTEPMPTSKPSMLNNINLDLMGSGGANKTGFGGSIQGSVNAPVLTRGNTMLNLGADFAVGGYRSSDGISGFQGGAMPTVSITQTIPNMKSKNKPNKKQQNGR